MGNKPPQRRVLQLEAPGKVMRALVYRERALALITLAKMLRKTRAFRLG